jgi:hypothetical protein
MSTIDIDKIIYQLTVEDLQIVAEDILDRAITADEIKIIEEKISDHINWYEAIYNAINLNIKK